MLLGELLVKHKVITELQLSQALKAQTRYPNMSIGQVVSKVFNIPIEIIETTMITKSVLPKIEVWFKKNIDQKSKKDGIPPSATIKEFALDIAGYTRYEGEAVHFLRNEMGYYCEDSRDARMEKLAIVIKEIQLTTRRNQLITLNDIHLDITLGTNEIRSENPGFIAEARLKLLHALKQKATT